LSLVIQLFLIYAAFLFGQQYFILSVVMINYFAYLSGCTSGLARESLMSSL